MKPRTRTVAVVILAGLVAVGLLAAWEIHWRQRGYEPALYDDRDYWAVHRQRVVKADQRRNLAVIGASRIQLAFSTRAFEQRMPGWTATSLAINGHYPAAVLHDLAADDDFAGVLLIATDARGLAHYYRDMSAPWVRHYRRDFGPQRRIERHLLTWLQERLVLVGGDFNLITRLIGAVRGEPPPRHYTTLLADRTIAADFDRADVAGLRRHFVDALAADYAEHPPPSPSRWRADLEPIAESVRAIERRGGTVVFLRMPTADDHWRLDRENYPREHYWDHLAPATGAETVHFRDHRGLAELELPDTSHIDRRDRERFTTTLVRILVRRGVLPGS